MSFVTSAGVLNELPTMVTSSTWISILAMAAALLVAPTPATAQAASCQDRLPARREGPEGCSNPSLENVDADGDGVCDLDDAFPNDPCEWVDTDGALPFAVSNDAPSQQPHISRSAHKTETHFVL